jgi:hypothetical protein
LHLEDTPVLHARKLTPIFAACATLALATAGRADVVTSYGVFADNLLFFSGGVTTTASMGSNADMFLSGGTFGSLRGGGSLNAFGSGPKVTGDVVFDNNVMLGTFSQVTGNINAGGDALLRTTVTGNVVAGGTVLSNNAISGNITSGGAATVSGTVGGNLSAAGSITLSSTVSGNATYGPGKSLHLLGGGQVLGTTSSGPVVPTPQPYDPVTLPAAHNFSSGGLDVVLNTFDDMSIPPGSYGDLIITGANEINMTAGNYYFDSITMINSFVTFNFDSSGGPINIFVTGAVLLHSPDMRLNGVNFSSVDPANAGQVYWEVHDAFSVDFADVLGTVYTPFGDINIKSLTQAKGRLISGHDIIADGLTFVPGALSPTVLVPEPSALVLASFALGLLLAAGRRTRTSNRLS